jgi:hypothetical protein
MNDKQRWWQQSKNEAHGKIIDFVTEVEQAQFDVFNRFVQLAALYDPNGAINQDGIKPQGIITENVVASNADTVKAIIATVSLRARITTDDGDWSQQRQARAQELYAEGLEKLYDVEAKAIAAFGSGPAIRGTGLIYASVECPVYDKAGKLTDGHLVVEHVLADDLVVPDIECRDTPPRPRQAHRRKLVDKDVLKAKYPKFAIEIDRAQGQGTSASWQMWAGYRPLAENEIVLLHSHFCAIGEKGKPGYVPGRETIVIDGCTLFDEEWPEDFIPYARVVWEERNNSFYGISLAERIVGHQQVLNNSNYQIDRLVNLNAMPTIFVSMADANLQNIQVKRPGTIVPLKGSMPQFFTPPAISPEVYKRVADVKSSASQESGINEMLQRGTKPAGLDSGAALRELRDSTTQRFSSQEKAYELFRRDVVILMLAACKRLGRKAPAITQRTRFGTKKIEWSKVDLKAIKTQISMASGLPRTVAGRTQMVLEWAQAGLIDTDESRRLLRHPDLERSLSLFTAGVEALEHAFDLIADGEIVMPEPFMPLQAAVKRGQFQYLEWWRIGAPEEVMEAVRQFVVQAADMLKPKELPMAPAANDNAMPMDPAMDPMAANANMPMPAEAPPQAALAAQAMNLRAV